jgi:hypothetical protein
MQYSGLAIQDAVTLEPDEMRHDIKKNIYRVVTSRQKTGTHVSVLLPPDVAEEVIAVKGLNGNPQYIFWNRGEGKPKAAVDVWEGAFKRVFKRAGISKGHSHQLPTLSAMSPRSGRVSQRRRSGATGKCSRTTRGRCLNAAQLASGLGVSGHTRRLCHGGHPLSVRLHTRKFNADKLLRGRQDQCRPVPMPPNSQRLAQPSQGNN